MAAANRAMRLAPARSVWDSFRMATWLGWQIESNWTDPLLFAGYSIAKPLASAAILVIMYSVITQGNFASPVFPYIYLGNAFFTSVGAVMTGVAFGVIDDRERYKMLKYMYIGPVNIPVFMLGRGMARFITGSVSVLITIVFGVLFLHVTIIPSEVNWPLFAAAFVLGVVMLGMLGLLLGSIILTLANNSWSVAEATAGALFLFSGAIFPLDELPNFLRPIGYAMPMTYWLELLRRALVGRVAEAFPTLRGFSDLQLLGILCGLTLLLALVSFGTFRLCDYLARERGLIDRVTNY